MKRLYFLVFCAQIFWQSIAAQAPSAYEVYPNPSDTVTAMDVSVAHAYAQIKNVSADSVFVKWERKIISVTPGVVTAVCDPVRCWYVTTNSNSVGLAPDSVGELTVSFGNTTGQAASGIVHLKLTNLGNAADTLTAIYTYSTLSGTNDLPAPKVKLFPNPTTDFFTLTHAEEVASMQLYNLDGRVLARFEHSSSNTYSIADQPVGTYVLSFEDKNGQLFQAVEIHKR
ncbi:MAG: T9SS type A sorting domain-containing protein [Phycisphaerae bacterium]|nr:T9SS type A sorting domain-containing protein [Saprospiraceae bacterium]